MFGVFGGPFNGQGWRAFLYCELVVGVAMFISGFY